MKTFFRYCLRELKYTFQAHQIELIESASIKGCDAAGDFFIAPCSATGIPLELIKQCCEDFEQQHPLGRFIDADLNDQHGNTISSGKSKLCFFCLERPAIECRRENAHDPDELRSFMFSKMEVYNRQQWEAEIVVRLSSLAQQALLTEISLTPKPGLVDKFSTGCHSDMNYQMFIDSTAAIAPWFGELVSKGFVFNDRDLTKALPIIRGVGLRMESSMFKATNHINTQKGIIFLMGLSLFTCGRLFNGNKQFDIEEFRTIIRAICKGMVKRELSDLSGTKKSHGEIIFQKYGYSGARGEAESGFQTVFEFGLPLLAEVAEPNQDTLIQCFLSIASANDDTNILYRSNPEVLTNFRQLCGVALENFNDLNYSAVIDYCKTNNISPGGSADLLAVTIFVWLVMNNNWLE